MDSVIIRFKSNPDEKIKQDTPNFLTSTSGDNTVKKMTLKNPILMGLLQDYIPQEENPSLDLAHQILDKQLV